MEGLLFKKNEKKIAGKLKQKIDAKYKEVEREIKPGVKVMMKKNHQVGEVLEIRGKRAVVKVGMLPMQVEMKDLKVVEERANNE
jgi:DNA mismatch repair protein MutS2